MRPTIDKRFWAKVAKGEPSDCWEWQGYRSHGYGVLYRGPHGNQKSIRAHRMAWEQTHGPIPDGLHVCHRCDNPPCVNPAHMFLGTPADNAADRDRKGRCRTGRLPGSMSPTSKLTESDVLKLRQSHAEGATQMTLAGRYGVRQSLVSRIVRREAWRHI